MTAQEGVLAVLEEVCKVVVDSSVVEGRTEQSSGSIGKFDQRGASEGRQTECDEARRGRIVPWRPGESKALEGVESLPVFADRVVVADMELELVDRKVSLFETNNAIAIVPATASGRRGLQELGIYIRCSAQWQ